MLNLIPLRILITILFCLIIIQAAYAQKLSGTWRVAYLYSLDSANQLSSNQNTSEINEEYRLSYGILEFNKKEVIGHFLQQKPIICKIKNDNSFEINGEELSVDKITKDSIVLSFKKHIDNYLVLLPYSSEKIELTEDHFAKKLFRTKFSDGEFLDLNFHFLDSNNVILNNSQTLFGYTNIGQWKLLKSEPFFVLSIVDERNLDEYTYYLIANSEGKINAIFPYQVELDYPYQYKVNLVETDFPSNEAWNNKKENLIGLWEFEDFADTLSMSLNLNVKKLGISLKRDSSYKYFNNSTSLKVNSNEDYEQEFKGTWKLAQTGTYIILEPYESYNRRTEYITIVTLNERSLIINFDLDEDDIGSFHVSGKFIKKED